MKHLGKKKRSGIPSDLPHSLKRTRALFDSRFHTETLTKPMQ